MGIKRIRPAAMCSRPDCEGGGYLLSHFRSTIGVAGFNFSVRNGKRWNPRAVTTLVFLFFLSSPSLRRPVWWRKRTSWKLIRGRLNRSLGLCTATVPRRRGLRNLCIEHGGLASRKGFGRLVLLGSGRCRPCTCNLSTSSSLTALCGNLILGRASCLDAFSTYPDQTRIPGGAPGGTTGKPEVCPTRSSRTSVGAPQISCAHNR